MTTPRCSTVCGRKLSRELPKRALNFSTLLPLQRHLRAREIPIVIQLYRPGMHWPKGKKGYHRFGLRRRRIHYKDRLADMVQNVKERLFLCPLEDILSSDSDSSTDMDEIRAHLYKSMENFGLSGELPGPDGRYGDDTLYPVAPPGVALGGSTGPGPSASGDTRPAHTPDTSTGGGGQPSTGLGPEGRMYGRATILGTTV